MATVGEIMAQGWRHHQAGELTQAELYYRQAMQVDPNNVDAWYLCGVVCQLTNRLDEAVRHYREALRLRPDFAEVQNNLGVALAVQGRYEDALPCYRQALLSKPGYAEALNNQGLAFSELGRLNEGLASLEEAVRLRPDYAEAYYNLGNTLQKLARFEEAIAAYETALRIHPNYAEVFNNLGAACTRLGDLDRAVLTLQQARAARPHDPDVHLNLANTLKEQGRLDEALDSYRQALTLQPASHTALSNYLVCLNYHPRITPAELLAEHRRYDEVAVRASGGWRVRHHASPGLATRPLRVGYVSPDFYHHAAAHFIEPILAHHDPGRVEAYCYAEVSAPDLLTDRFRSLAQRWRSTFGLTDAQVAEQIQKDAIDILVDLGGHTAHNRLPVFARKPAPIQVTCLGYPNTTGLSTMDYRLTDAIADPPGEPVCHSEELVRLPGPFCCYVPLERVPDVGPLPALIAGHITFGCLQNLAKLNDDVLDLWAGILRSIPTSRLLIFRHTLVGETGERFRREFARRGVGADRLDLRHTAGVAGFLGVYHAIDISLDSFPWSGHTTACESLWMGVPVLTLRGNRHAGRMAASLLTQVGLTDWIASNPDEYLDLALRFATNVVGLSELRSRLREMMRASPLCDGARFTRGLEEVYRSLWIRRANGSAKEKSMTEK